ncbi:MAG: aminodeoxychorismate lyase [Pseudomonadota bacterium]
MIHFLDSVPLGDRGLHYGDGLFETMAVVDGTIRLFERHLARLELGAARLMLPQAPMRVLRDELAEVASGLGEGVLKLIMTRGSGGRGYALPESPQPSLIVLRYPGAVPPVAGMEEGGVRVRLCETRLARQPRLAGIKHLNRLEYVLARAEWSDPTVAEGLLLDSEGWLVEGVVSNVFFVRAGCLCTPLLDQCGVDGVMRQHVMTRAAALGVDVMEVRPCLRELLDADEVFITNSLHGIRAVTQLDGQRAWTAGPLTALLREGLWA